MRNFKEYSDMEVSILVEEMQAGKVDYSLDDLKDCQAEIVNRRLNSRYAGIVSDLMKDKLMNKNDSDIVEETPAFMPLYEEESSVSFADTSFAEEGGVVEPLDDILSTPEPALYTPPVVPAIATNSTESSEALYNKMQDLYSTKSPKMERAKTTERTKTNETDYPVFKFLSGLLSVLPWLGMLGIYGIFGYNALYGEQVGNFNFLIYGGIGSVVLSFVILLTCLGVKENLIWKMKVAKKLETK